MTIWTPHFSEDEEPNIEGAVYQALGAASVCWENTSGTGIFQSDEVTRIAEGLLRFIQERDALGRARADARFWEVRWSEAAGQREEMQVERDAARAEVERIREVARTNFDLFTEAKREMREAVQERDLLAAEVAQLAERNALRAEEG